MRVKRRSKKRSFNRSYKPRSRTGSIVRMKKTCYTGAWSFSTASTAGFWRYNTYTATNSIQNFAEIAALFDEYKINAIKVTYRPRYDDVTISDANSGQPQAYAHVIVDPSSTALPSGVYGATTLNTLLENDNVKTFTLNKPFSVYFKPKVQDQLFGGGTSSRVLTPTFMKTSENSIDHRGFHMYIQQNNFSNTSTGIILDTFVTVYMQCRNLK